jgi:hypothetical protein
VTVSVCEPARSRCAEEVLIELTPQCAPIHETSASVRSPNSNCRSTVHFVEKLDRSIVVDRDFALARREEAELLLALQVSVKKKCEVLEVSGGSAAQHGGASDRAGAGFVTLAHQCNVEIQFSGTVAEVVSDTSKATCSSVYSVISASGPKCFLKGTLLTSPSGMRVPVELLDAGSLVC